MAWINLAKFCSWSILEVCDWITAFVVAICQNTILNTNSTQSGTASVTRMIIIVLVMVKHSVLQTYLSKNLLPQQCTFTHLLQETAVWSFLLSDNYFLVSVSSGCFCCFYYRRPNSGTVALPVAWGVQEFLCTFLPSVNVGRLLGSCNSVKLIQTAGLLWGCARGIVWFQFKCFGEDSISNYAGEDERVHR